MKSQSDIKWGMAFHTKGKAHAKSLSYFQGCGWRVVSVCHAGLFIFTVFILPLDFKKESIIIVLHYWEQWDREISVTGLGSHGWKGLDSSPGVMESKPCVLSPLFMLHATPRTLLLCHQHTWLLWWRCTAGREGACAQACFSSAPLICASKTPQSS